MFAASDPNLMVGGMAAGGLTLAALWKLIAWVCSAPVSPDPWDPEIEKQIQAAQEICPHCSTPQPPTAWFCEHCGRSVGPYNNLMPFLQIFSQGEVFRNGTDRNFRKRPLVMTGYFLLGLSLIPIFLAPVYWFSLLMNYGKPAEENNPPADGQV